jgi:t-SNARE complex subunit (syntaxin)
MSNYNLGHGSTKRERPKGAFETTKDNYSNRIDFGKSKISDSGVYRARWTEKKSWFWTTIKLIILGFILFVIFKVLFDLKF